MNRDAFEFSLFSMRACGSFLALFMSCCLIWISRSTVSQCLCGSRSNAPGLSLTLYVRLNIQNVQHSKGKSIDAAQRCSVSPQRLRQNRRRARNIPYEFQVITVTLVPHAFSTSNKQGPPVKSLDCPLPIGSLSDFVTRFLLRLLGRLAW